MIGVATKLSMKRWSKDEKKWRDFGGIEGPIKVKRCDQLSLGSLDQLSYLAREI